MKYALAVVCPPLALQACGKSFQSISGWVLLAMGIALGNVGVVIVLHFLEILWAWSAVGHQDAHLEAQQFVHEVHLYRTAK